MSIPSRLILPMLSLTIFASCTIPGVRNCAPVYGNWCGKGYPAHGSNPDPIDEWDGACKAHDECYAGKGSGDKTCDREFVATLHRLSTHLPVPHQMIGAESYFRPGLFPGKYAVITVEDLVKYAFQSCEGSEPAPHAGSPSIPYGGTCCTQLGPCSSEGVAPLGISCWCNTFYGPVVGYVCQ